MDAVWHGRSDEFRDELGLGIGPWEGVILGANVGRPIVTIWRSRGVARPLPNYLGQYYIT